MPTLLEETEIKLSWSDIESRVQHPRPKKKRSPGVHLMSGIIRPVLIESGILRPFDKEQLDAEEMPLRMALGMAAEDWLVGLWPEMIWQPGELAEDGVIGSPDGVTWKFKLPSIKRTVGLLEEFKCTWMSRKKHGQDITQHSIFVWQAAAYCYMLGVRHARFHILWVNGDYNLGPPSPVYHTYLLEYTQKELDTFWANVILPNRAGAPEEK